SGSPGALTMWLVLPPLSNRISGPVVTRTLRSSCPSARLAGRSSYGTSSPTTPASPRRGSGGRRVLALWPGGRGPTQGNLGPGDAKNSGGWVGGWGGWVIGSWPRNKDVNLPWLRDKPVIPRGYRARLPDTRKIVQLTGEFDRQGWNGTGTPLTAHNRTETR